MDALDSTFNKPRMLVRQCHLHFILLNSFYIPHPGVHPVLDFTNQPVNRFSISIAFAAKALANATNPTSINHMPAATATFGIDKHHQCC
jgi:hypothetical protein